MDYLIFREEFFEPDKRFRPIQIQLQKGTYQKLPFPGLSGDLNTSIKSEFCQADLPWYFDEAIIERQRMPYGVLPAASLVVVSKY